MSQHPYRLLAAAFLLLGGTSIATSQDFFFNVNGELTEESTEYSGTGDMTESVATVELASANFQMYSIDMSMLEDGQLNIEWFAPEGTCFELQVPTTYDDVQLAFEWQLGDYDMGVLTPSGLTNPSLIFTGLTGTAALREQVVFYRDNGMYAVAFSDLVPGETVRFESVFFSVGIEASVDKVYTNLTETFLRLRAIASQTTSTNTPADAGQWLRLADKNPAVADPNAALKLQVQKNIRKLQKKLRKAKKKRKTALKKRLSKKIRKLKKRLRKL